MENNQAANTAAPEMPPVNIYMHRSKASGVFSPKLFWDGFQRLKGPGLLCVIATVLFALAGPVMSLADYLIFPTQGNAEPMIYSASQLALPFLVTMILSPFFAFSVFGFLRSRAKSDFYHSLPYTRLCAFFSYLASVLAWLWGTVVVVMALRGIIIALSPTAVFSFGALLNGTAAYLIVTLQLTAFASLACVLAGTGMSAFLSFALMASWLRLMMIRFSDILAVLVPILNVKDTFISVFLPDNYLPVTLLNTLLTGLITGTDKMLIDSGIMLYSLAVSLLIIALAAMCYRKRKSEAAENSSVSRLVQSVFRIMFASVFIVAAVNRFLQGFYLKQTRSLMLGAGSLFIAFAAYFLYELITTKSWKKTGRCAVCLPVLLCVGLCISFGAMGVRAYVLNATYTEDDIKSVALGSGMSSFFADYESRQTAGIEFTEQDIITVVADSLTESAQANRKGEFSFIHSDYSFDTFDSYDQTSLAVSEYVYRSVRITLKNGRTLSRNIRIKHDEYAEMEELMKGSEEYLNALLKMPEKDEILYIGFSVSVRDPRVLWDMFITEYGKLSAEEKLSLKYADDACALYFTVSGITNGASFSNTYYVPSSMQSMISAVAEHVNGTDSSLTQLADIAEELTRDQAAPNTSCFIFVTLSGGGLHVNYSFDIAFDADGKPMGKYNDTDREYDKMKEFCQLILTKKDETFDAALPFFVVELTLYDERGYVSHCSAIMNITQEEALMFYEK